MHCIKDRNGKRPCLNVSLQGVRQQTDRLFRHGVAVKEGPTTAMFHGVQQGAHLRECALEDVVVLLSGVQFPVGLQQSVFLLAIGLLQLLQAFSQFLHQVLLQGGRCSRSCKKQK